MEHDVTKAEAIPNPTEELEGTGSDVEEPLLYTELLPMDPVYEESNNSLMLRAEEVDGDSPFPPVIHMIASDNVDVVPRPMLTGDALEENEREIVMKLFQEEISYTQVADLLGDDAEEEEVEEESDIEMDSKEGMEETVDHAVEFDKELTQHRRGHCKKSGRARRKRRKLPDAVLQGLMGEANLRFSRRQYDEATKMCMEIIRQYPNSSLPYETLGLIYEAKGMLNKSLQFLFIAAFLSSDSFLWVKLATLFTNERMDISQAIFCWSRAIRANPENLSYHEERCKLYEKLGDKSRTLRGYTHMFKFLQPNQGIAGMKLAKYIAEIHFEKGDFMSALEAMEAAFKKFPSFVGAEEVNLILDLLMSREMFVESIEILVQHMGIRLSGESLPTDSFSSLSIHDQVISATKLEFPSELPVDLQIKCIVVFILLKNVSIVNSHVKKLLRLHKKEFGDLLFEISEAYRNCNFFEEAIEVLEDLLECLDVAAVWLLYGECLFKCFRLEEAASAYSKVIELAPQLNEPRIMLSNILQTLGRPSDALIVLGKPESSDSVDCLLCYHKCKILQSQNLILEFAEMAQIIFDQHCVTIRSVEEAEIILTSRRSYLKMDMLRDLRRAQNEPLEDFRPSYTDSEVSIEEQWDLLKNVFESLCSIKRYAAAQRLCISALSSKEFVREKDRAKELQFLSLLSSVYNKSFYLAFNAIRDFALRDLDTTRAWNLFSYISTKNDDQRLSRFLIRLSHRRPNSVPIAILNGHNSLACGTYTFAIAEYTHAFKKRPKDPLLPLMLGITYFFISCQKFSSKKNSLVTTGTAFFNMYLRLRGECQESFYNIGRAMHQIGLFHFALSYYRKALECAPPSFESNSPSLDLSKDIAFHISLIYRRSGNLDMARMCIKKYCRFDASSV